MNIIDFLKKSVNDFPKKTALIFENDSFTFEELWKKIEEFSVSLSSINFQNIISLMAENSSNFIIAYLGIINSGKTVHLISPEISEKNFIEQITSSKSSGIICSDLVFTKISQYPPFQIPIFKFDQIKEKNNNINPNFEINETAYLIYTSGTTSKPKGVGITHSMVEFTTKNIIDVLKYSQSDIDILPLPLFHSFGLGCLHTSLLTGSTLILLKNSNDIQKILDTIKNYNATTLSVIPATLSKMLQFDESKLMNNFSGIRLIMTNSTKIPINTIQSFKKICINGNLATYYGLTEASRSTFMIFDENSSHDESVGRPSSGIEIKIVTENSFKSNIGEIWIKGQNVISKYWNNPLADENLIDGWLKTGDLGYFDNDNYLYLSGRTDDLINIGGEKVMPEEIESIVKQIPGVENVIAFGIEHEIFGQVVKLHIIKSSDSSLDKSSILKFCIKHLERYKVPTKIDFVTHIPYTDYGKVKRFMLK